MPALIKSISTVGFTLIELLVVISILAILSSIGLVFYNQAEISARDSRRMGDMREIQKALELHYTLRRTYPHDIYAAGVSETTGNGNIQAAFQAGSVPTDPQGLGNYSYVICDDGSGAGNSYITCSRLEVCDNKCNRDSLPAAADACSRTVVSGNTTFYCVGSLSN